MCNDSLCFLLCTHCSFRSVPVSKTVGKALPERLRDGETAGELSIPHSGIPAVLIVYVNHVNREFNAMFHTAPDNFCAAKKLVLNKASVHTQKRLWRRDFCDGATKLRCANLESGVSHIGQGLSHTFV